MNADASWKPSGWSGSRKSTGDRLQSNRSDSKAGVLRGLHYHFKQIDYWYATRGNIRVGLVDLRLSSATYLASATIDIGEDNAQGIFIPEGVAHGFAALTDCTLMYMINNYYDGGKDEYGIAWKRSKNRNRLGNLAGRRCPIAIRTILSSRTSRRTRSRSRVYQSG